VLIYQIVIKTLNSTKSTNNGDGTKEVRKRMGASLLPIIQKIWQVRRISIRNPEATSQLKVK
jgi:hypothetical protein